jgi:anti-sigma factor RsiW
MVSEHHDHKHCLELFDKLSEYLDHELDEITCRHIEKHVKECMPCCVCMETLKRTIALCRSAKDKPVPGDFSKRLYAMIMEMQKKTPVFRRD